jgi:hypothetical protein
MIPLGKDVIAHKRAKLVNYVDDEALKEDEKSRLE